MGMTIIMVTGSCGPNHLLSLFTLLIIIEYIISLELLELRVPAHVALGTRASLSCRWALGPADVLYSVKWYKDGKEFFRHVPRDQEPRRKFPLPGVDVEKWDTSGSSLVLSAAVSDTGGRYRCEVSGERPLFPTVSGHADIEVVVLPEHGPIITGLQPRYRIGDQVQINCTSGRSRPSSHLSWYINGEPAPTTALQPPIHHKYGDQLETITLLLEFLLNEQHFKMKSLKVKCLATLNTLYWRSNEGSALLEKDRDHNGTPRVPSFPETNTIAGHVHSNFARSLNTSRRNTSNSITTVVFATFLVLLANQISGTQVCSIPIAKL